MNPHLATNDLISCNMLSHFILYCQCSIHWTIYKFHIFRINKFFSKCTIMFCSNINKITEHSKNNTLECSLPCKCILLLITSADWNWKYSFPRPSVAWQVTGLIVAFSRKYITYEPLPGNFHSYHFYRKTQAFPFLLLNR